MLIWNSCEVPPDTDRKILLSIHNTERLIIAYYDTCNYCCYIDDGLYILELKLSGLRLIIQ